jgi:hypothetical protein
MPKTFEDPNPHISILDDGRVKKQIADQARAALDMADRLKTAPPLSEEQAERERFQFESNEYAAQNPLYAAARGSNNFLVVPLEPNGTKPLVELSEATRDDRQLFEWWTTWPDANPGIVLGRVGGVFALRVDDLAAWARFREMAKYESYDEDRDTTWIHYREIGGASVRLLAPSEPFSMRSRMGWGRQFTREVGKMLKEERQRQPQTFWLVYSYHPVVSGMDAWDFRSRSILPGVKLLGEGEVLLWDGAVLDGGVRVAGIATRPPEVPIWLAQAIGKPRSRKVMQAAREQHEATLRMLNAYWMGVIQAQQEAGERAKAEALAEHERATRVLEEAEK